MNTVQLVASISLSMIAIWLIGLNLLAGWNTWVRKRKTGSLISLLGGSAGAIALLVGNPYFQSRHFWWLPLVIDPGSTLLICVLVYKMIRDPSSFGFGRDFRNDDDIHELQSKGK